MRQYGTHGAYCAYTHILMRPVSKGDGLSTGCCAEVNSKTRISRESPQPQWHQRGRPFDQHYEDMRRRERRSRTDFGPEMISVQDSTENQSISVQEKISWQPLAIASIGDSPRPQLAVSESKSITTHSLPESLEVRGNLRLTLWNSMPYLERLEQSLLHEFLE